ncbi:MAG: Omp28-related outer membrane protein [Olleya sp.]
MKKTITLSIATLTALSMSAQLPVSKMAGKKQALLEEYTGNTCGFCPAGHKISDDLKASKPKQVFAINIHTGDFARPVTKDFRTPDSDAIYAIPTTGVSGFPAGVVNRTAPLSGSPQKTGGWATSRGLWASNASVQITQNTYINIAGQAYVHPTTRKMIVNMEAYYTAAAPSNASMKISVALLQSNVIAYQRSASTYYPAMLQKAGDDKTYKHNHALRKILTAGSTGEAMTGAKTTGTTWKKTYNYTVPADIPGGTLTIPTVLNDLELIAFITDGSDNGNVVAVCKVPLTVSTSTDVFGLGAAADLVSNVSVYPNPMVSEGAVVFTLGESSNVNVDVVNALGQVVKSDNLKTLTTGEHKYELDATNLTNGIYFVNINVGNNTITKKVSVLK